MNHDRLDELVRQAQALDTTRSAALDDPDLRRRVLQEVTTMDNTPSTATAATRRRLRLAAVAVAAASAAGAVVILTGVPGDGRQQPAAAPVPSSASQAPTGDVFGQAASCVEKYSPHALTSRAFAFDGTVRAVGQADPGKAETFPEVPVTFEVHHWYRGGQGQQVTISMMPPGAITSAGNATYSVGSRLLVSGEPRFGGKPLDDPIAWSCGFTRWHTAEDAQTWQQTLG